MTISATKDIVSGVRRPGLGGPKPTVRVQRAGVPGGGALLLDLAVGDSVAVRDPDGGQVAHISSFAMSGHAEPRAIDFDVERVSTAADARALTRCASAELRALLTRRGIELATAKPFQLLGQGAGATVTLTVRAACLVLIAAPTSTDSSGIPVASPLDLTIQRAGNTSEMRAPSPLADVRLDLLVPRRNAIAYEVKAGEYIQVVDIAGRQCSDFIAFPRRALDKGLDRFIDNTVTHTMVRGGYPRPGLTDKFFDQDMQPLLAVIQDTCGRHDTFGLACTRRTYEAYGMPGHDNCSDNISRVGAPYGVAPRIAWPAINFFFNTMVDHGSAISSDEGWSRPGDFVLMKALTDLVCVSTACPDDTSPINGWDPTDCQVRVYDETKLFRKSIGFRMTPDAAPQMTRETGFHPRTSALTRHFVVAKDCWVPAAFLNEGAVAEYWATREVATIQDLSQLRKFDIAGPDAERLLDWVLTRDIRKVGQGQVVYAATCRPTGAMFDDGTLFRLGPNTFRWMCGDAQAGEWLREQATAKGLNAQVRNVTDSLNNVAVQGPRSREILAEIIWTPDDQPKLLELKYFRFLVGRIGGYMGIPVVVSRTGYTGELGYEVFCSPKDAIAVWDAIMEAGASKGLKPMGAQALDLLRIEAALPSAGAEFGEEIDPFEAGCGFAVPLDKKPGDFVGRDVLVKRQSAPHRELIGLKLDGREGARHGDGVYLGKTRIGVVTSACISPSIGTGIAMARVQTGQISAGVRIEIGSLDQHQKRLLAIVVPLPFYDPEKKRPRA
jgi:aminomethyltransferase